VATRIQGQSGETSRPWKDWLGDEEHNTVLVYPFSEFPAPPLPSHRNPA